MAADHFSAGMDADFIPHDELVAGIARDEFVLVDVLPLHSYRNGHLPGARHLPFAELERRAQTVLPDRDAEIVVYCSGFA